MSTTLLVAIIAINVVSIPQMVRFTSNMGFGTAGLISGMAITYFTWDDKWGWLAALATIIAGLLFIAGILAEPNAKKASPWFIATWIVGIFGSLLPTLWGLNQTVKMEEINIPWGAIITIGLIISFFVWLMMRKSSDSAS